MDIWVIDKTDKAFFLALKAFTNNPVKAILAIRLFLFS
jgi:hypothetical protein